MLIVLNYYGRYMCGKVRLQKICFESQLGIASDFRYRLIKLHGDYARKLGIHDSEVDDYTLGDARKSLLRKDRFSRLIEYEGEYVGMVVFSHRQSVMGDGLCCYIHSLYIKDEFRSKGIGAEVISLIKSIHNLPVELSCYYELEAHSFYRKLGFVPIKTFYRQE